MNPILKLEVAGKLAHFRKFYGNSTALSYSIPPRTTIMGMLASMLGLEKGSYHEAFQHENLRIGISVKGAVRKSIHVLNHLKVSSPSDLNGSNKFNAHTQIPFEIVMPEDLATQDLQYAIYLTPSGNAELFERIQECCLNGNHLFNLTFGTANFHASLTHAEFIEQTAEKHADEAELTFHSAINSHGVQSIIHAPDSDFHLTEELLPAEFKENESRELQSMSRMLFSTSGKPFSAVYTGPYSEIKSQTGLERITFIEPIPSR
ncbi:CRISPR-associated protein Cas5 [Pontibacter sp. G13]|uniref:CRISPR-associated protein Cas5 n=1 Tax=Pontibacter sp. G13 TaxID=3074898 RepID=UPI00288B6D4D|nr:CRISPR-associated protein Cas5 [Pontibacter sp. G13]WNJ18156.1 CRISPR-associated protein Cas5 [Pontibacter sp. G13]